LDRQAISGNVVPVDCVKLNAIHHEKGSQTPIPSPSASWNIITYLLFSWSPGKGIDEVGKMRKFVSDVERNLGRVENSPGIAQEAGSCPEHLLRGSRRLAVLGFIGGCDVHQ
jgi:hypothetical protein